MPLQDNALATLADTKAYLKVESSDTSLDDLITALINAASDQIEEFCHRSFHSATYTDEEYDGNNRSLLILKQFPVSRVSAVKIDDVALDASEYKLKGSQGFLYRVDNVWPCDLLNIKVTYTAGLSTIPAALELACKHLVLFYYKTDIADFSRTFGEGFVLRPDRFPRQVEMLLRPYVRVVI